MAKRKTIYQQLDDFIDQNKDRMVGNQWIESDKMHVYVRKAYHVVDGKWKVSLDIGSIEVDEKHRQKGHAKRFISHALKVCPWNIVYVENVQNPILREYLRKENWIETDVVQMGDVYVSHFYKQVNEQEMYVLGNKIGKANA
jgi:GNAT superfamily N-acetyltransferase